MKRKYPKQVSAAVLLEFAKQAVANAEAIAEEARILATHERWPRAVALLILAREELARSGYASQLSIGGMPLGKDSLAIVLGARKQKHALSRFLDVDWLFFPLLAAIDAVGAAHKLDAARVDSPEAKQVVEALLPSMYPPVPGQSSPSPAECMGALVAEIKRNWIAMVEAGGLDAIRQDAQYVSISPNGLAVLTPERTTQAEFQVQDAAYGRMHAIVTSMLTDNLAAASMDLVRELLTGCPARSPGSVGS